MSESQRAGIVLIVRTGRKPGRTIRIPPGETVIGRDEDCRIRLASNDVSRKHASIHCTATGLSVTDLNSRNGTYVNEIRIDVVTPIEHGDQIRVGPLVLERPAAAGAPAPTTKPKQDDERASDDDIAAWLSGDEPSGGHSGDTTIVSNHKSDSTPTVPVADSDSDSDSSVSNVPPPSRTQFDSIAEEAQDIFRRFRAAQRADHDAN